SALSECWLFVSSKDAPQHVAHLADRGVGAHALEDIRHQVGVGSGGAGKSLKRRLDAGVVTTLLEFGKLLALMARHALVNHQQLDGPLLLRHKIVDADDNLLLALERALIGVS